MKITPDCDCFSHSDTAVAPDAGILLSYDPVAIDLASLDIINKVSGKDVFKELYPEIDHTLQIEYGAQLGLGNKDYNLVTIERKK